MNGKLKEPHRKTPLLTVRGTLLKQGALTLIVMLLSACTTTYSSLKLDSSNGAEIIVTDEATMLTLSRQAIERTFPKTVIGNLALPEKGFTFYTQPLLDRTDYKFVIIKTRGITANQEQIEGYGFAINAQGTQGLVRSRYIDPLLEELRRTLAAASIRVVPVRRVLAD